MTSLPEAPTHPAAAPGPLAGIRVVELASEWSAYAGKLLADLGAEVVLVEPREGAPMRDYAPFAGDEPGSESSLWWWHYQTSKRGVTLDLQEAQDRALFVRLVANAHLVLEGETAGHLAEKGIDHPTLRALDPALIWVSITPFGRTAPGASEPATDLTLLASGGPVWSCGYDDHALPPVRGGGNQALHTGGLHAVASALAAVLHQQMGGEGQHVDVSLHAAANVTTEEATFRWLVAGETVQRQTGRHASPHATMPTMVPDVDGQPVNTGAPPRLPAEFEALLAWLADLELREQFAESFLLELGVERGGVDVAVLSEDAEAQAIYGAGREALILIAGQLRGYDYFVEGQRRGLATSVIHAPEDVLDDPHFIARGFPTPVYEESLGRAVVHPGAPIAFGGSPWRIRARAPRLGEHNAAVLGPLRSDGR
jgi:crotonobetainyl-CoA:carnitine CoA-transferase CaiB-like acyl-CoA transferase